MMDSDNFFPLCVTVCVLAILALFGFGIWYSESKDYALKLACIEAGKSVISGQCVKVAP